MIMARSVLEVIITEKIQSPANEHGKDKTLNAKLRDAAKEGVISKRLGDLAATIKDVGNGSTHNIFEEISKDYAEFILSFMDTLIEETYQEDGHLAKLASLSQQLKQVKAEKLSINSSKHYYDLQFSPAVETIVKKDKKNPKRVLRDVKKQLQNNGIGTKSQQALKLQHELKKEEYKSNSKHKKQMDAEQKFKLKQQKKKAKHRGH